MVSIAEKLDGQNLTQKDIGSRFGVFDEAKNLYRFPDGSAGRLIKIERKGNGSKSYRMFRFIYLRAECSSVDRPRLSDVSVGVKTDREPGGTYLSN